MDICNGMRFMYQDKIRTFFWADADFYHENKYAILEWAKQYNCDMPSFAYGWVQVPDDNTALLFMLRWS